MTTEQRRRLIRRGASPRLAGLLGPEPELEETYPVLDPDAPCAWCDATDQPRVQRGPSPLGWLCEDQDACKRRWRQNRVTAAWAAVDAIDAEIGELRARGGGTYNARSRRREACTLALQEQHELEKLQ